MYNITQNMISNGAICLSTDVTPRYIELSNVYGINKNQIANKKNVIRGIVICPKSDGVMDLRYDCCNRLHHHIAMVYLMKRRAIKKYWNYSFAYTCVFKYRMLLTF